MTMPGKIILNLLFFYSFPLPPVVIKSVELTTKRPTVPRRMRDQANIDTQRGCCSTKWVSFQSPANIDTCKYWFEELWQILPPTNIYCHLQILGNIDLGNCGKYWPYWPPSSHPGSTCSLVLHLAGPLGFKLFPVCLLWVRISDEGLCILLCLGKITWAIFTAIIKAKKRWKNHLGTFWGEENLNVAEIMTMHGQTVV